jgi:hypothetical protein
VLTLDRRCVDGVGLVHAAGEANRSRRAAAQRTPRSSTTSTLFTRLTSRAARQQPDRRGRHDVVSLLIKAMAGYAFAKLRFAGASACSALLLALVIPARSACCRCSCMLQKMGS